MLLSGISLLVKPDIIFLFIENNMANTSLYVTAIVVRLVFGVLLLLTASKAKYSGVIKFFGYLFVIAAFVLILMGEVGFKDFFTPLISDFRPFAAIAGLFAIVFGGFLIFAFSGGKEKSST